MYERGDIVAVDFPFTDGSSVKQRPAIVISNNSIRGTGDVVIVMVTSKKSNATTMVALTTELLSNPLPKYSFAKCHRLYTIHSKLVKARYSRLNGKGMSAVMEGILSVIS